MPSPRVAPSCTDPSLGAPAEVPFQVPGSPVGTRRQQGEPSKGGTPQPDNLQTTAGRVESAQRDAPLEQQSQPERDVSESRPHRKSRQPQPPRKWERRLRESALGYEFLEGQPRRFVFLQEQPGNEPELFAEQGTDSRFAKHSYLTLCIVLNCRKSDNIGRYFFLIVLTFRLLTTVQICLRLSHAICI